MSDLRAVLYDIHGNLPALEAVLADAQAAGAERFVLGGDYGLFGAFPRETVERLREFDATWIRGNTDRWVAGDVHDAPGRSLVERSLDYCRREIGEFAQSIGELPETTQLEIALFCHASPRSDMESFAPEASGRDDPLLDGTDQAAIVFGHTHLQFEREADGRLLVNPGSVGLPLDGDRRAAYALWRGGGDFVLRRIAYDSDAYAQALRERLRVTLRDDAETLVRRVQKAAFVD